MYPQIYPAKGIQERPDIKKPYPWFLFTQVKDHQGSD
jgi:hypothetical protein